MNFLKDSIKEFDHVVWPTRVETIRYFWIVTSMIAAFSVFLFLVGSAFSTSLFSIRNAIAPVPAATSPIPGGSETGDIDLSSLLGSGAKSLDEQAPAVSSDAQPAVSPTK